MSLCLYERRLEEEWKLLASLERLNPDLVKVNGRIVEGTAAVFCVTLRRSPSLVEVCTSLETVESHQVRFRFPAFYPAVHLEAFLDRPVFHPNVHPVNGFVCLWKDLSCDTTILEAIEQLRRVISYQLVNESANHVMQPRALNWLRRDGASPPLPFPTEGLQKPREFERERTYRERPAWARRRRLV
jgi:hypothetical protein